MEIKIIALHLANSLKMPYTERLKDFGSKPGGQENKIWDLNKSLSLCHDKQTIIKVVIDVFCQYFNL